MFGHKRQVVVKRRENLLVELRASSLFCFDVMNWELRGQSHVLSDSSH